MVEKYHPASLLSVISENLEKLMNNLFFYFQYDFIANLLTFGS